MNVQLTNTLLSTTTTTLHSNMSRLGHGHAAGGNPKGLHYIANLGAALVRGAWGDANPGAAPNGSPLSWSELIRKWGKHTGGSGYSFGDGLSERAEESGASSMANARQIPK